MYTFNLSFRVWNGHLVRAVMRIEGMPDRNTAIECIRAQLTVEGYRLETIC
jgi:hypothetical protein